MLVLSPRSAPRARVAHRNRTSIASAAVLEQAGGLLVSPVVVVAVCSLLTSSLIDMVVPAVAMAVAWIVGYSAAPMVLPRSGRRLPWAIGASIVRAASVALLAYVLSGDASREQRLRSILICLAAYGLSTGLARGVTESLWSRTTAARRPGPIGALSGILAAVVIVSVGAGAFAMLVDVPRAPLPRLSALFALAAALTGAAVILLARVAETPRLSITERRGPGRASLGRRDVRAVAWLVVSSLSSSAELLLIVGLLRHLELPRAYLLSGVGAFLAAAAIVAVAGGSIDRLLSVPTTLQLSALLSALGFTVAVGLATLLELEQAPDTVFGRRPSEVGAWAAMALVGAAHQTRRRCLPRLIDHTGASPRVVNWAGVALAVLPLALAELLARWGPRDWLLVGLGAGLVGIVVGGFVSPRSVADAPPRVAVGPVLARTGEARPLGGR